MGEEHQPESAASSGFKLGRAWVAVGALAVLLVVSMWLWTLPFQTNPMPFGEGDSAWHFAIGDHISSSDKAAYRLPYYIGVWYYGFNRILGPFAPEYPPSSHVNYAMMQVAGADRFVPVFIYRAFGSFLGVVAVFFVVWRLFGVLPAFLAGLGLAFSLREQMTYLFGQQPTLTAIVLTPVASYAWFRFLVSLYERKVNYSYLFAAFALLASQFMLHIQGFAASVVFIGVFSVLMAVRFRRIPLSMRVAVRLALALAVLAVVAAPFAAIYLGAGDVVSRSGFGRLFEWGISPDDVRGSFPESFVSFSAEYPSVVLPFLAAGVLLLLLRLLLVRNNVKELFVLSWLVGMYIVVHLDVFIPTGLNRLARMLVLENHVFFTLIAMSVVWLPQTLSSLLRFDGKLVSAAKYSLAAVLVVSIVFTSGESGSNSLKAAYGGIDRITPVQADFAASYLSTLPDDAFVYDPSVKIVGQWRYPKMRWMLAVSRRHIARYEGGEIAAADFIDKSRIYFMFDYSDIALLASSQQYQQQAALWAGQLQQGEQQLFNGTAPVYDVNNIRLYRYECVGGVPA